MLTDQLIMDQDPQCRFAYLEELQRGTMFRSTHQFPAGRNYPNIANVNEDVNKVIALKSQQHFDFTSFGSLYAVAFKPWVDAAMSLLLEVGNLLLHQTETLLLLLYHLQKGPPGPHAWAHGLLIVAPPQRADLRALFVQRRQVLDSEVPLCRVLRDYDRAVVQGLGPSAYESLLDSLNKALQMGIALVTTAAAGARGGAAAASLFPEALGRRIREAMESGDVAQVYDMLENRLLPWEPPCFMQWGRMILEGGEKSAGGGAGTGNPPVAPPTWFLIAIPDKADPAFVRAHAEIFAAEVKKRHLKAVVVSRSNALADLWPVCSAVVDMKAVNDCMLLWRRFFLYSPIELLGRFAEPDAEKRVYRVPEIVVNDPEELELEQKKILDQFRRLLPGCSDARANEAAHDAILHEELLAHREGAQEQADARARIAQVAEADHHRGAGGGFGGRSSTVCDLVSSTRRSRWMNYNLRHWQESLKEPDSNFLIDFVRENQKSERVLVYRCASIGFCGGHGDRLHGILGLFMLALVTKRAFYIDSPRPLPLGLLLEPSGTTTTSPPTGSSSSLQEPEAADDMNVIVDWRLRGSVGLPGLHANRNDKFSEAVADVVDSEEQTWVLHSNQRITTACLHSHLARKNLPPRVLQVLQNTPFLHAHLFELLFQPTNLLANRIAPVASLIGIHFRAGNASADRWRDPQRHERSELLEFLRCAQEVERQLRLDPASTRFFLAADAETEDWEELQPWYRSGKLIGPSFVEKVQTEEEVEVEVEEAAAVEGEGKEGGKNYGMEMNDETATKIRRQKKVVVREEEKRFSNAVVHLDRSSLSLLAVGMAEVWAQWYALGFFTEAVVLSASGFGATAAEVGRQVHTWFGKGCVRADVSAT
eukprot:g8163.t1